ncbi:hypothetical protein CLOP_g19369, partial [Closterium sp. NIES-67]
LRVARTEQKFSFSGVNEPSSSSIWQSQQVMESEAPTHIDDLPDDILEEIIFRYEHPVPRKSESDDLWDSLSLNPTPMYLSANLSTENAKETPLPIPPPSANALNILLVSSVCRRWRHLSQRCVSTLLVGENLAVSRRDLASVVAFFANITHLHLCDGSVETLDDAFLAHLASSCPELTILHVGSRITPVDANAYGLRSRRDEHPVTHTGLDLLFRRCVQLEQLSLYCVHPETKFPASFYQLAHLHTLALTSASPLESPNLLANLTSLTHLHILFERLTFQHLASLARLPSITSLSISDETISPELNLAQLPLLKASRCRPLLPSPSPCTSIQRLEIVEFYPGDWENRSGEFGRLLPRLRELTLCGERQRGQHRPRSSLPQSLTTLSLLERLTVSNCPWLSSLPGNFGDLPALKSLVLRQLSLSSLPDSLSRLSALKILVLHTLPLSALPDSIGQLSALDTLVLYQLPLSNLPDSLCHLPSLETFFLIGCTGRQQDSLQLPEGFCCLSALQTLCIADVPRLRLPKDIGQLQVLQTLFLNRLLQQTHLPPSFTQLTSLTRLELGNCMLRQLPTALGNLTSLKEVHLHSCRRLQELPESLTSLSSLEVLMVDGCTWLSSIPRYLDSLGKLKRLELTGCQLATDPPISLPLSLEILSLGNSYRAADLPDVSLLPKLRKLNLKLVGRGGGGGGGGSGGGVGEERMPVRCDISLLTHLELTLPDDAEQLPFSLGLLPQLNTLIIWSAGKIQKLPRMMGWALPRLRKLHIHRAAELRELPQSIGALSRLGQLTLSDCPALHRLPASLTLLACLHELTVEETALGWFPPGFGRLTRLRRLSLQGCLWMQALPEDVSELKLLQILSIGRWHVLDYRGCMGQPSGIEGMYGLKIE